MNVRQTDRRTDRQTDRLHILYVKRKISSENGVFEKVHHFTILLRVQVRKNVVTLLVAHTNTHYCIIVCETNSVNAVKTWRRETGRDRPVTATDWCRLSFSPHSYLSHCYTIASASARNQSNPILFQLLSVCLSVCLWTRLRSHF